MLGIGFWELAVVGTVALVVIGPGRLPETARFFGHFLGRIQRQISGVKADIRREMALEDMKKIHREYQDTVQSVRQNISDEAEEVEKAIDPSPSPATPAKDDGP
jgi:sec-independent protein translocase protein TatB